MKNLKHFIKLLFALTLIFFVTQGLYLHFKFKSDLNIIGLETADRGDGAMILYQWYLNSKHGINMLQYAWINTIVDFFFIIAYTGMILIISKALRLKEKNPLLNKLLYLDKRLAIIAAILDILENIILLYDMKNYYPGEYFISSMYISWLKWIIIFWIILTWTASIIKSVVNKSFRH